MEICKSAFIYFLPFCLFFFFISQPGRVTQLAARLTEQPGMVGWCDGPG